MTTKTGYDGGLYHLFLITKIKKITGTELARVFDTKNGIQWAAPTEAGPVHSTRFSSPNQLTLENHVFGLDRWCLYEPSFEPKGVPRVLVAVEDGKIVGKGEMTDESVRYAFPGCLGKVEQIVADYNQN